MKLDIPKFRYLAQDFNGNVFSFVEMPYINECAWYGANPFYFHDVQTEKNKNWQNTLIDLETDDYEFEDGILRRIER